MSVYYLQGIEDFLGEAGDVISESDLSKKWNLVKAGASALWDSDMNKVNRAAIGNTVVPALGAVAPVLDAPMNALQGVLAEGSEGFKRGFLQEEDYNYGQALPQEWQDKYPNITGSVAGVGEVLADPINLLTAGGGFLAKQGAKGLKDAGITNEAFKGMYLSQPANYIDNFYGDGDPDGPLSKTEQMLMEDLDNIEFKRLNSLKPLEKRALVKKITGFARWGIESLKASGKTLLDPEAKALFAQYGINKNTQKILREELMEAEAVSLASKKKAIEQGKPSLYRRPDQTKPFQKAVAQTLFQDTVPKQAGRVGKQHHAIESVVDSATLGGVGPLDKGRFIENVVEGQHSTKSTVDGKPRNFQHNTEDLSFAYDQILDIWGIENSTSHNLVVKKSQGTGGDHATDAIKDNPSRNISKAMFGRLEKEGVKPTIESMYDTLFDLTYKEVKELKDEAGFPTGGTERVKRKGVKIQILNPSKEHAMKHGLWVTSSRSGKGIKEGGVNIITKINPNMTTMSHVSDEHNFLEKARGIGPLITENMPHREITITPPIYTDLRDQGAKGRVNYSNKTSDPEGNRATRKQLRAIKNARADPSITKAIKDSQLGRGMLGLGLLGQSSKLTGEQQD